MRGWKEKRGEHNLWVEEGGGREKGRRGRVERGGGDDWGGDPYHRVVVGGKAEGRGGEERNLTSGLRSEEEGNFTSRLSRGRVFRGGEEGNVTSGLRRGKGGEEVRRGTLPSG